MKYSLITVLVCVVSLEAKPKPHMGVHGREKEGLGFVSHGFETGHGGTGLSVDGLSMGHGKKASEYLQDSSFDENQYDRGENGFENEENHSRGFKNFHDVGHHHSSVSSITHSENSESHDIGGSQAFDTGAQSNTGHNQFANGRTRFGNRHKNGREMESLGVGGDLDKVLDTGLGVNGLGMGPERRASEYTQDSSFGDNQYNNGENGFENETYHSRGFKNFHDVGQHHSSITSITKAENTDSHDIGGSQAFDTGSESNTRHKKFDNGRSRFGNRHESESQLIFFP